MKILISNQQDMLTVASILFKNGYTVRMAKEKLGSKTTTYLVAEKTGERTEDA